LGVKKNFDANLTYSIKESANETVVYSANEVRSIQSSYESFVKEIPISANVSLGSYMFTIEAQYDGKKKASTDVFEIVQPFWTPERMRNAIIITALVVLVALAWFGRKQYIIWKASKARYIFPVNMNKLPKGSLWLGKIAETDVKSTFDIDDLRTHMIVAGATGSGKSVTGSIIAEELLEKKVPIVVFDPTAQWTGFVRPCTDPNILKFYKSFGLKEEDKKPYKGMIYEVTSPKIEIDFKKYMNPGEITVFTLNKLQPGEYDEAVTCIIDAIFRQNWEESTKLQLVIVFDEVHRLLEKYGGKGGYIALERACREFRKWGIGLIMISQVLSDFKEAIKGNVLTEVQMHTKSLGDLIRIEKKYGLDYTKRVAREEIGVGMIQNPKYNNGAPWFVSFRPTLHMPHKLLDKEMATYKEFSKAISEIEDKISILEKSGINVFDMKTELKLAKDKLKEGRFSMADIYIKSLTKKLADKSARK
ncbi:MAG TPA: helicase HerA-like domain-containing protein, partial [archaeon]|nr:helicase HerA-like domain-containing protein [archaeon]